MEFLFEFLFELLLEATFEASKSKKTPKFVRYPLIILILFFFASVIGLILFVGFIVLKENILGGIVIILIGLIIALFAIKKII